MRSQEEAGAYVANETFPAIPMRRDTFMVHPLGNIVLRFRADNPGTFSPLFLPPAILTTTQEYGSSTAT